MTITAKNQTKLNTCTDPNGTGTNTNCYVCNDHDTDCTSKYTPAYTGLAVTSGANFLTATPLHYDGREDEN
jgi:hypothetical protein